MTKNTRNTKPKTRFGVTGPSQFNQAQRGAGNGSVRISSGNPYRLVGGGEASRSAARSIDDSGLSLLRRHGQNHCHSGVVVFPRLCGKPYRGSQIECSEKPFMILASAFFATSRQRASPIRHSPDTSVSAAPFTTDPQFVAVTKLLVATSFYRANTTLYPGIDRGLTSAPGVVVWQGAA